MSAGEFSCEFLWAPGVPYTAKKIGHGTFADCYMVTDPTTGQVSVVKAYTLHEEPHCRAREVALFNRIYPETPAALHEFRDERGNSLYRKLGSNTYAKFMCMPYFGTSLASEFPYSSEKRLAPAGFFEFLLQGLIELKRIHALGILHLDIKPANTVIDADGKLRFIDFGNSREVKALEPRHVKRKLTTPYYKHPLPDGAFKTQRHCERTDLFGFAMSLYECFNSGTFYDYAHKIFGKYKTVNNPLYQEPPTAGKDTRTEKQKKKMLKTKTFKGEDGGEYFTFREHIRRWVRDEHKITQQTRFDTPLDSKPSFFYETLTKLQKRTLREGEKFLPMIQMALQTMAKDILDELMTQCPVVRTHESALRVLLYDLFNTDPEVAPSIPAATLDAYIATLQTVCEMTGMRASPASTSIGPTPTSPAVDVCCAGAGDDRDVIDPSTYLFPIPPPGRRYAHTLYMPPPNLAATPAAPGSDNVIYLPPRAETAGRQTTPFTKRFRFDEEEPSTDKKHSSGSEGSTSDETSSDSFCLNVRLGMRGME